MSPNALSCASLAARLSSGNSKPLALRGYVHARSERSQEAHEVLHMLETVA